MSTGKSEIGNPEIQIEIGNRKSEIGNLEIMKSKKKKKENW